MELVEPAGDRWRVRLAWYAAIAAVTVAYLTYNFRLHHAELSAPLCPLRNDSVAVLSMVRAIDEARWPWLVSRLGAPAGCELTDSVPEHATAWPSRTGVGDQYAFVAFSLWCLLSYPITAICARRC